GGNVVPTELEESVIELRESYGVFRQNAKAIPMNSDTKDWPRRTSGVTAYFGGDSATMTESTKSWDSIKLTAKKLYCLTRWGSELNEDAFISIADDLANEIAYAFALKEDQSGFTGDGSQTYAGI